MKIEIKYFIASIFVGLCGVLYQTVSYKDFVPHSFKKFQKNNNQILQPTHTLSIAPESFINRNARDERMNQLASETAKMNELSIPVKFIAFDQAEQYIPDMKKNLKTGALQDVSVNKGLLDNRSGMFPFSSISQNQLDPIYPDQGYGNNAQAYPDYFGYYPSYGSQGSAQKPGSSMVGQSSSAISSPASFAQGLSGNSGIEPVPGRLIGAGPKSKPYSATTYNKKYAAQDKINTENNITPVQTPKNAADRNLHVKSGAVSVATGLVGPALWKKLQNYVKNKFGGKKADVQTVVKPQADPIDVDLLDDDLKDLEPVNDVQASSNGVTDYIPMLGYESLVYSKDTQPDVPEVIIQEEEDNPVAREELFEQGIPVQKDLNLNTHQPAQNLLSPEKSLKTLPKKIVSSVESTSNQPVRLQPSAPNSASLPSVQTVNKSLAPVVTREKLPVLPDSGLTVHPQQLPDNQNGYQLSLSETQPSPELPDNQNGPAIILPETQPKKSLNTLPKKIVSSVESTSNQPVRLQPSAPNSASLPSVQTVNKSLAPVVTREKLPVLPDSGLTVHPQQLPDNQNGYQLSLSETQPSPPLPSDKISTSTVKNLKWGANGLRYGMYTWAIGQSLYQDYNANNLLESGIDSAAMQAVANFNPTEQPTLVTGVPSNMALPDQVKDVFGEQNVKLIETGLQNLGKLKPPLLLP